MSSVETKKKSINDIFNEMDFEENFFDPVPPRDTSKTAGEGFNEFERCFSNELLKILPIKREPKLWSNAVEAASKAQTKWKNLPALERANFLHKIWKFLKKISLTLSNSKSEFLTLVDYFDFYSDWAVQTVDYKNWKPHGVVLIILSNHSPFFVLGATVAAALATGCSIIVAAPTSTQIATLFLEEVFAESGLHEGLLNTVAYINDINVIELKKINKVFFCGSYLSAKTFYTESSVRSFNFFCPNNTAALILETSDLNAAANKIVSETWGKNSFFAVSNVIVQESIFINFLEKLKYRIEQFMTENKNSTKFKDEILAEKINKTILKAIRAGALVERSTQYDNKWSPTVLLNYQSQDITDDVPVLKVLTCRSAKEGVILLNNCRYSLGTSVWSEVSSQALEVSSMLVCPNIWINCHGMVEASEPIQLTGFSGNCVLGGNDGMLEYLSCSQNDPVEGSKSSESKDYNIDKLKVLETAFTAYEAFNSWKNTKNRRQYLKDLAISLEDNKELSKISGIVSSYAHLGNIFNSSARNTIQKFVAVKIKVPIGVILLFVNTSIDIKFLASLVTLTMAMGNAVIFVLKEENPSVEIMIKCFSNILPKHLVSVIFGQKAVFHLASDPNIQAIWFYDESTVSAEFLKKIKAHTESLKRIWVIPKNVPFSQQLFQKKCLRNKVVWQTKIDQFQGN